MPNSEDLHGGRSREHAIDDSIVANKHFPETAGRKFWDSPPRFRKLLKSGYFGFDCIGEVAGGGWFV